MLQKQTPMDITLTIDKSNILDKVRMTTAYLGKKADAEGAFERMYATEMDDDLLSTYFEEAMDTAVAFLKPHIKSVSIKTFTSTLTMNVSNLYNTSDKTTQSSLSAYFVAAITAKWLAMVDKVESERYAQSASALLEDVDMKLYHKVRPTK